MTDNNDQIAATKPLTGYKHPPTKTRFQKGRSGNPRGRPKESRNVVTVLSEALNQPVTLRQDGKSRQVTKGDALIGVLLNMASKGERRAVDAVINLIGKIERLVEQPEERKNVGVMVVPGVAQSIEKWRQVMANWKKRKEMQDQQRKIDAPKVRKREAALRETIALHKGTPEGDAAAASLAELTSSMEYRSNFYIKDFPEEEIAVDPPKEEPPAKLPWDADEYVRMPFYARDEYARTHSHDVKKPEPQPQLAPHPCYRLPNKPYVWSSVPWSEVPPDDPRFRGEPLSDGQWGK
jgi:hypothetical protein